MRIDLLRGHGPIQEGSASKCGVDAERILNTLRWKYLKAIALSPALRKAPAQAISSKFNAAFKSLIGLEVEQGGWQARGFDSRAKHELDWERDLEELTAALRELSKPSVDHTKAYAELIALKPGFHEAWCHENFPNDVFEALDSPRGRVFAILRGHRLPPIDLTGHFPDDPLDGKTFLAYAACAITEGPIHRRRFSAGDYFSRVAMVGSIPNQAKRRAILLESFEVLDYRQLLRGEDRPEALERVMAAAEGFQGPLPLQ